MSEQLSDKFGSLSLNTGMDEEDSAEGRKTLPLKQIMGRTWNWSPIEGLHHLDSIRMKNEFIRQEISRMIIHPEASVDPTLSRKKGIVIGVTRAVSNEIYGINNDDIIVEEMDTPKLAVAEDGETVEIKNGIDSKWKEELSKPLNFSETEDKMIEKLISIAPSVILLQGYLLFKNSNNTNTLLNTAILALEKYFFTDFEQFSWWKENEEELRDAIWNKSVLPLKISFKKKVACSNSIKQFLNKAGVVISLLDVGNEVGVYRDLMKSLYPMFSNEVKWKVIDEMVSYLENFSNEEVTDETDQVGNVVLRRSTRVRKPNPKYFD